LNDEDYFSLKSRAADQKMSLKNKSIDEGFSLYTSYRSREINRKANQTAEPGKRVKFNSNLDKIPKDNTGVLSG